MNLKKNYKIKLPSLLTIGFIGLIGFAIGYLGPFDSYQMPLASRLMYWVAAVFMGYFIYYHTIGFFNWYFEDKKIHSFFKFIVPSLIAALVLTTFIQIITNLIYGFPFFRVNISPSFFLQVFIVGLIVSVISMQFHKSVDESSRNKPDNKSQAGKPFLDRIPHKLGDRLVCFVMEDHYLKITTTKGEHMLLMRMKDALVELEGYDGFQVHRSWWVARDAVSRVKKQSHKIILVLENDMQIPVSRTYMKKVKESLM